MSYDARIVPVGARVYKPVTMRLHDIFIALCLSITAHTCVLVWGGFGGLGFLTVKGGSAFSEPGVFDVEVAAFREGPSGQSPLEFDRELHDQGALQLPPPRIARTQKLSAPTKAARTERPYNGLPNRGAGENSHGGDNPQGGIPGTGSRSAAGIIAPEYPLVSRRLGEEGRVRYRILLLPDKEPRFELVSSSGFSRLDRAAEKALRSAPVDALGNPADGAVERTIAFTFRLKDSEKP